MGLFSRKKSPPSQDPLLATNAPPHWPPVHAAFVEGYTPANTVFLGAALVTAFEQAKAKMSVAAIHQNLLFEEGILEVPVFVEDKGVRRPVFLYSQADAEAGRNFSWVQDFLQRKGFPPPVYYAPAPLQPGPPQPQLRPFDYDLLHRAEEPSRQDGFMWWSTPREPRWNGSRAQGALRRAYAAMDGYESYFCGRLLHRLDEAEAEARVALPEEAVEFFVEGPLGRKFFVSVGSEKGIRFHFPPKEDWADYRDLLLTHHASFCEEYRRLLETENVPPDPPGERPRSWFTFMDQKLAEPDEDGASVTQVGGLVFLPQPAK